MRLRGRKVVDDDDDSFIADEDDDDDSFIADEGEDDEMKSLPDEVEFMRDFEADDSEVAAEYLALVGKKRRKKGHAEAAGDVQSLIKRAYRQNERELWRLLYDAPGGDRELETYFKHRMSHKEQCEYLKQLKAVREHAKQSAKPLQVRVMEMPLKVSEKAAFLSHLAAIDDEQSGETHRRWVEVMMQIPFGVKSPTIPVTVADGHAACARFLEEAREILNACTYGMDEVKLELLQYIAKLMMNPRAHARHLALHGPPGIGKTTLIKNGVAKVLRREAVFVGLGGQSAAAALAGSQGVWIGSSEGEIVRALIKTGTMTPIMCLDELDKVSDTKEGQDVYHILSQVTDPTQNAEFRDRFLSDVQLDVSDMMFVFSYNDDSAVNPILKDRLHRIKLPGYNTKDRMAIARQFVIPELLRGFSLPPDSLVLSDRVLEHIATQIVKEEKGVRNLQRALETVLLRLNMFSITESQPLFGTQSFPVVWPFEVKMEHLPVLLPQSAECESWRAMYV